VGEKKPLMMQGLAGALVVPGAQDRPAGILVVKGLEEAPLELGSGHVALVSTWIEESEVTFMGPSLSGRISDILINDQDKIVALRPVAGRGAVLVRSQPAMYITYGDSDSSLQIHSVTSSALSGLSGESSDKIVAAFEDLHREAITVCEVLDKGNLVVTGSTDGVVAIWRVLKSPAGKHMWRLEQVYFFCTFASLDRFFGCWFGFNR